MKPVKFNKVIEETAKRTGQPVEVINAILRLYFKDLRLALTSLTYPRVQILNLGTFNLKANTIEKRLWRRQAMLHKLSHEPMRVQVQQEIDQLERSLQIIAEEKERKKAIRKTRNTHDEQRNEPD